jgi:probable phosphoglycerate mutase
VEEAILVRHAETELNISGLVNGDPVVVVALTEAGARQARRLGEALADEPIELCVTSEFGRTQDTADLALAGREIPRLELADLNDPRYGTYEGRSLEEYREWASQHGPTEVVPGDGGESRAQIAHRYARAARTLLARPERLLLVVTHSLPVRYLVDAAQARVPGPRVGLVEYGRPYRLRAGELEQAAERLERWCRAPSWQ